MKALYDKASLENEFSSIVSKFSQRPIPPKWAIDLSQNEKVIKNITGLMIKRIQASIANDDSLFFGARLRKFYKLKYWEPGLDEYLTVEDSVENVNVLKEKYRQINILTIPDKILHIITARFISDKIDSWLSDSAFAYRQGKGQPQAVKMVRHLQNSQDKWIVTYDVKSFNETVSHEVLMALLEEHLFPLIESRKDEDLVRRILDGLFKIYERDTGDKGKGVILGSSLTSVLTNIYLSPVDKYLEQSNVEFVRYGDDLVAFCDSYEQAQQIYTQVDDIVTNKLMQKANQEKSGLIHPGIPFNFIGFRFNGEEVNISQTIYFLEEDIRKIGTFNKVKSRIEKFTSTSRSDINSLGGNTANIALSKMWYVEYLLKVIYDFNLFLGYKTDFNNISDFPRGKPKFINENSFPATVLKSVSFSDIKQQFKRLDRYLYARLSFARRIALGANGDKDAPDYFPNNDDIRQMGLRTFKDIANRFRSTKDIVANEDEDKSGDYYYACKMGAEGQYKYFMNLYEAKQYQCESKGKIAVNKS